MAFDVGAEVQELRVLRWTTSGGVETDRNQLKENLNLG